MQTQPPADLLLQKAVDAFARKEWDSVITFLTKYIALDPGHFQGPDIRGDAYNLRGEAYSQKGDYERAIEDYGQALELVPDNAAYYSNRGLSYSSKGDYGRAIEDCARALELAPENAWAYLARGHVYSLQGDYGCAIEDYDQAFERDADGVITRWFPFFAFFSQSSRGMAKGQRAEMLRLFDHLSAATSALRRKAFAKAREKHSHAVHYSSASAAWSLIKKGGRFRIYNAANMSDPEEGWTMFDLLKGGGYREAFYGDGGGGMEYSPIYIGCFIPGQGEESDVDDALLYWRLYGRERGREAAGCSLRYSSARFAKALPFDASFRALPFGAIGEAYSAPRTSALALLAVFYGSELEEEVRLQIGKVETALDGILRFREQQEADQKCASLINTCTRGLLDEARFLFKSRHYAQEREARLIEVFYPSQKGDSPIKEDCEAGGVFPRLYVELPAEFRPEKVVLGPRALEPDSQASYIKSQADYIKYRADKIKIVRSRIPAAHSRHGG